MKLEIGESVFYSWLRHIKCCQIVQNNWKVSPKWILQHTEELERVFSTTSVFFQEKYQLDLYKHNASLSQLLRQAECDVVGLSSSESGTKYYAVDVAFHTDGLNYKNRKYTVAKVIAKSLRTAMCIYGYFDCDAAEIYFASPKINPRVMQDLWSCIADAQEIMNEQGFHFTFNILANETFQREVMLPILSLSEDVADTSELFLRSYQMTKMFSVE